MITYNIVCLWPGPTFRCILDGRKFDPANIQKSDKLTFPVIKLPF